METTTQTAEAPSALDNVRSKLQESVSRVSSFRTGDEVEETSDESTSNKESDRGTTDTSSQESSSAEKETSQTENNAVASNGGDENKESTVKPKESRENARIRELNEKANKAEARAKELEAKLNSQGQANTQAPQVNATQETQQPQKQEIPQLVPPPPKPQYTKQQLLPLLKKYQDEGNADMAWAVQQEIEKVRDYEIEAAKWENQNARAWENHQSQTGYWQSEANKKWPDLAKQDSTISKAMQRVSAFIKDVQSNPAKFNYNQAYMADVFDRSQRFDAAEAENKQLREKIATLEKKGQPANQTDVPEVESSSPSPKTEIKTLKGNLLQAIRQHQSRRPRSQA